MKVSPLALSRAQRIKMTFALTGVVCFLLMTMGIVAVCYSSKNSDFLVQNDPENFSDQRTYQELEVMLQTLTNALELERANEIALKEKLQLEQNLGQSKSELLSELTTLFHDQKSTINQIEEARLTLAQELERTKADYSTLVQELKGKAEIAAKETQERMKGKHRVSKGDTLSSISLKHYGTTKRWQEIYQANQQVISSNYNIRIGSELVIP